MKQEKLDLSITSVKLSIAMKKTFSIVLSITLLISTFGAFNISAFASIATSGSCGDSATWSYADETLTISGTGKMKDYTQYDPTSGSYTWNKMYVYNYPWTDLYYGIKNVVIEEGITYIGCYAFADLENLESVEFSSTVKSIGKDAFYRDKKLSNVNAPSIEMWCDIDFTSEYSNPIYCSNTLYINGELVEELTLPNINTIKACTFIGLSSIKTPLVIPNTVEEINGSAFKGCSNIPSIVFSESLVSIGGSAFSRCKSLKELNLPNSLTEINYHAFEYCHGLTEVRIPDNVKYIYGGAFFECMNLKSVYLGLNIYRIEPDAFEKVEYGEPITDVYYYGDEDSLSRVKISDGNDQLIEAEWHFIHSHEYAVTDNVETAYPHAKYRVYKCDCGTEYKEIYMPPNKFTFEGYSNGYFYYHCEICDETEYISKSRIKKLWDYYFSDNWVGEYWYNETCLDIVNDGVINAKDYAKYKHLSNYGW